MEHFIKPFRGKEYLVLMPADEAATDIIILEVEPVDEETENYLSVQDETILNAVYDIFKEKYKDVLTFEEEAPVPPAAKTAAGFFTFGIRCRSNGNASCGYSTMQTEAPVFRGENQERSHGDLSREKVLP